FVELSFVIYTEIEVEFKRRGRELNIPVLGYILYVRRLQILLKHEEIVKSHLVTLGKLWKDILCYKPFHLHIDFHKAIIKLYIVTKLLYVDSEGLHPDVVLDTLPYFNWDEVKLQFNYQDDSFKDYHAKIVKAALEAIEASAGEQVNSLKHLKNDLHLELEKYLQVQLPKLLIFLMDLIPTTALEKMIDNVEIKENLKRQNVAEYTALLNALKNETRVTEAALNEVLEAILTKTKSQEQTHAERTEEFQVLSEVEVSQNITTTSDEDSNLQASTHGADTHTSPDEEVDVIIHKGKIYNVKRGNAFEVPYRHASNEHDTGQAFQSPNMLEVIIHKSEVYEIISGMGPQVGQRLQVPQTVQSLMMKSNFTDSDLQDLESAINHLETLLPLLKEKLRQGQMKISAGSQSSEDENSNSDNDENPPSHFQSYGNHADSHVTQQLANDNSQAENSCQQESSVNGEHSLQISQLSQNSDAKNSGSQHSEDEDSNSDTADKNPSSHFQSYGNHADSHVTQQLTDDNRQAEDSCQQESPVNGEHSLQISQLSQNSDAKNSLSVFFNFEKDEVSSQSHLNEYNRSPLKIVQDKSQGVISKESLTLVSPYPNEVPEHISPQDCDSNQSTPNFDLSNTFPELKVTPGIADPLRELTSSRQIQYRLKSLCQEKPKSIEASKNKENEPIQPNLHSQTSAEILLNSSSPLMNSSLRANENNLPKGINNNHFDNAAQQTTFVHEGIFQCAANEKKSSLGRRIKQNINATNESQAASKQTVTEDRINVRKIPEDVACQPKQRSGKRKRTETKHAADRQQSMLEATNPYHFDSAIQETAYAPDESSILQFAANEKKSSLMRQTKQDVSESDNSSKDTSKQSVACPPKSSVDKCKRTGTKHADYEKQPKTLKRGKISKQKLTVGGPSDCLAPAPDSSHSDEEVFVTPKSSPESKSMTWLVSELSTTDAESFTTVTSGFQSS
ncbi:hypothetical protein OTU49_003248, partial [Cherax quadricarinatus]